MEHRRACRFSFAARGGARACGVEGYARCAEAQRSTFVGSSSSPGLSRFAPPHQRPHSPALSLPTALFHPFSRSRSRALVGGPASMRLSLQGGDSSSRRGANGRAEAGAGTGAATLGSAATQSNNQPSAPRAPDHRAAAWRPLADETCVGPTRRALNPPKSGLRHPCVTSGPQASRSVAPLFFTPLVCSRAAQAIRAEAMEQSGGECAANGYALAAPIRALTS
eukprot:2178804-Pleurochrysis_carterae.AAC.3